MATRNIADLDPRLQPLAHQFLVQCLAEGLNVFLTCCYRSDAEQDADYAQGRTKPGKIITNARAGQSPHNYCTPDGKPAARGFDFALKTQEGSLDWDGTDEQWTRAIHIGESLGLSAGADFKIKDYAHMELPDWKVSHS